MKLHKMDVKNHTISRSHTTGDNRCTVMKFATLSEDLITNAWRGKLGSITNLIIRFTLVLLTL